MPTLHFFRWANQLKDSGYEVFWFDITGMSAYVEKINWIHQKIDWKLKWNYPKRNFVKKRFPGIYDFIQKKNEKDTAVEFERYLNEVKPDIVHSFALYVSCAPIIDVMEKYVHQKWIYSSWGSDLFYFQNFPEYLKDIKRILPRINYLFTDCKRDYNIAKEYGFKGEFLGVFPGGGGFDIAKMETYREPIPSRKTILIKGFQGRSGRAIPVFKALERLKNQLIDFQIVVFGTDPEAFQYLESSVLNHWENFNVIGKISHDEVLQLMGKALIYVGNSNSDGMPNTLLEALCLGAFPIQSNPGGVTEEVINHGKNGCLIEDCENISEIKSILEKTIIEVKFKNTDSFPKIDYDFKNIQQQVILIYEHKII
ncbi:glycosyltransferase involved in cell wall biosynthesis [Wenyingzhuangia aestuarii]|nr:glycosyltransferase involved in cell wall biosynthesis [Wenyingzhuangia aestuarii]